MKSSRLIRHCTTFLTLLAVAAVAFGPPPKPKPKAKPKPGPKPGVKPIKPGVKPGLKPIRPVVKPGAKPIRPIVKPGVKRFVLPKRRRVVVRRVGVKPVVINSGTDLKTVPVVDTKARGPSYKVIDTDLDTVTVKVDEGKVRIRLLGIEPALFEGESPKRHIREFNRNLMLNEFVYLSSDASVADEDEEGNKVRYLYRAPDGLFLNLEIIRQGYAVAASGYDYKHKDLFGFYGRKAGGDKKGVYSLTSIKK